MPQKFCRNCCEWKSFDSFSRHKRTKDGLQPQCKACNRAYVQANKASVYAKNQAYREGVKEQIAVTNKHWYEKNRERILLNKRGYYERRREDILEKMALQYREHQDKIRQRRLEWRNANRDTVAHWNRLTKAQRRGAEGTHTKAEARALLERQEYCCANCEANLLLIEPHLDHFVPLILGGTNYVSNLQWLCATCNLTKGGKDPYVWLSQQKKLCVWAPTTFDLDFQATELLLKL